MRSFSRSLDLYFSICMPVSISASLSRLLALLLFFSLPPLFCVSISVSISIHLCVSRPCLSFLPCLSPCLSSPYCSSLSRRSLVTVLSLSCHSLAPVSCRSLTSLYLHICLYLWLVHPFLDLSPLLLLSPPSRVSLTMRARSR